MSPTFIYGCQKHLSYAARSLDRFHVLKEVNKALDQVRRDQRRSSFELKGHKYIFLKNNLTFAKELERDELLDRFKDMSKAYKLKEMFNHLWNIKESEEVMSFLAFWCGDYAHNNNLAPFLKTVKMIKVIGQALRIAPKAKSTTEY